MTIKAWFIPPDEASEALMSEEVESSASADDLDQIEEDSSELKSESPSDNERPTKRRRQSDVVVFEPAAPESSSRKKAPSSVKRPRAPSTTKSNKRPTKRIRKSLPTALGNSAVKLVEKRPRSLSKVKSLNGGAAGSSRFEIPKEALAQVTTIIFVSSIKSAGSSFTSTFAASKFI